MMRLYGDSLLVLSVRINLIYVAAFFERRHWPLGHWAVAAGRTPKKGHSRLVSFGTQYLPVPRHVIHMGGIRDCGLGTLLGWAISEIALTGRPYWAAPPCSCLCAKGALPGLPNNPNTCPCRDLLVFGW